MKILPNFASLAAIIAMLLMFTSVSMNIVNVSNNSQAIFALTSPSLILFLIIFAGTFFLSRRVLRFNMKSTMALVYSSSMKHLPLSIGIAITSFNPATSIL